MLSELLEKDVIIHYSPVESFALTSQGTIIDISEDWIKLKSKGKRNTVKLNYVNIDRILKIEVITS